MTRIGLITGALLEQRRHDDAVAFAAIIAQLRPDDAVASFRLGYALQMANRHRDALAPYRHALALESATAATAHQSGRRARAHAEATLAEQVALLESALKANPLDSDAWTNLAQASRFAMNLPRALEAGARAVELAPDSPLALNNYALALKEAQRWDEAVQLTQAACERAPGDPTMRSNLGDAAPRAWRLRTRLAGSRSALARFSGTGRQPAGDAGAAVAGRVARGQDTAGMG